MASNVLTLGSGKAGKEEKKGAQEKVESFMMRNRVPLLALIGLLAAAAVALCVVFGIADSMRKKDLAALDAVEHALTKNSTDLSDADLSARQDTALAGLSAYLSKGGVAGARANMLAADIYFQKKDWGAAKDCYLKAASAGEKHYTAGICYYNAAVCAEELGDNQGAAGYYETAAGKDNFYLAPHALFNLGRISESLSDFAKAKESYQKIIDTYSGDEFTKLAHSRLIALKASGKLE